MAKRRRKKNPKNSVRNAAIGTVVGGLVGMIYQKAFEPPVNEEFSGDVSDEFIAVYRRVHERSRRGTFWLEVVQMAAIGAVGGLAVSR